jgi:hypothetical protein
MTACVSDMIPRVSSTDTPRPTIAHFKSHGVTRLLVYCDDMICKHRASIPIDSLPDQLTLTDLQPRLRCTKCGRPGEPRPNSTASAHFPVSAAMNFAKLGSCERERGASVRAKGAHSTETTPSIMRSGPLA